MLIILNLISQACHLAAKSENARSAENLWQETAKAFTCTNKVLRRGALKESKLYGNELDVDADIAKTLLSGKTVEATIPGTRRNTQNLRLGLNRIRHPMAENISAFASSIAKLVDELASGKSAL